MTFFTDPISILVFLGAIICTTGLAFFLSHRWAKQKLAYFSTSLSDLESQVEIYAQKNETLTSQLHQERAAKLVAEEKARRIPELEIALREKQETLLKARETISTLELQLKHERDVAQEKIQLIEKAQEEFQNAFKALSAETLSQNNKSFLDLAKATLGKFQETAKADFKSSEKAFNNLVQPVTEALKTVNKKIEDVEKTRIGAYEGLKQQVGQLIDSQKGLRSETANLVKALRAPTVRGRWGEMQLRRVVEMSGMSAHCDFLEQMNLKDGDQEKLFRPDMVVNLPNDKQIIIDAKAPLAAYLEALEAKSEPERERFLKDHARQVRTHVNALSSKAYWDTLSKDLSSPEFVVLFLPGETFFTAALEKDPSLIEDGVQKNVIIATPATLIALLHAVAYGWRQESLAENAREISTLGSELYKRLADMGNHMAKLGRDIGSVVSSYNKTVGTVERRILPSARKFNDLQASTREALPTLTSVNQSPRDLQAPELIEMKKTG